MLAPQLFTSVVHQMSTRIPEQENTERGRALSSPRLSEPLPVYGWSSRRCDRLRGAPTQRCYHEKSSSQAGRR